MYDHPTAAELIAAAHMQLEQQVIPTITEPRLRFQTLVAANVLAIATILIAAAFAVGWVLRAFGGAAPVWERERPSAGASAGRGRISQ